MLVKCIDNVGVEWAIENYKIYEVLRQTKEVYFIKTKDNKVHGVPKERFIIIKQLTNKEKDKMGRYEKLAQEIGQVVDEKNKQYGDAINNTDSILRILYPEGIKAEQYKDLSVIVRVLDKIFRLSKGNEGEESAWNDIAGYGILMSKETNRYERKENK